MNPPFRFSCNQRTVIQRFHLPSSKEPVSNGKHTPWSLCQEGAGEEHSTEPFQNQWLFGEPQDQQGASEGLTSGPVAKKKRKI